MNFLTTRSFDRDLKKLRKKFRSIDSDLENVKKFSIGPYHELGLDNQGIFPVVEISSESIKIFKVKKIACKSLRGKGVNSGLRLVYANDVEGKKIELIEFYFKGGKKNMDYDRVKTYMKTKI